MKRYARIIQQGKSLKPKKSPGRPPKAGKNEEQLLQEDVYERPAATVRERRMFLESFTGKTFSDPTVRRLLKRLEFSQKTDSGGAGAR